jgi:hypothetical protein
MRVRQPVSVWERRNVVVICPCGAGGIMSETVCALQKSAGTSDLLRLGRFSLVQLLQRAGQRTLTLHERLIELRLKWAKMVFGQSPLIHMTDDSDRS